MYFDTTYKKAARRVNLLRSIRPSVDQKCAKTIYITMILLTFTCCVTWSWLVRHPKKSHEEHWTKKAQQSLETRVWKVPSIEIKVTRKSGQVVFECLQNNVFSLFSRILKDPIILFTRHNSFQVKLSEVGFEFGVKRVFTIKKPSFLMRSQLDFNP